MKNFAVLLLCLTSSSCIAAEKTSVKIVGRQTGDTGYNYTVPSYSYASSVGSANCYAGGSNVNCSSTASTSGYTTAPRNISYSVSGATYSLLLPDGRTVVVNCVSKYSPKGDYINRRSCRMPLVDDIQVEFKGKKAKLFWPASVDGRKTESETYNILGIIDK